MNSKSVFVILNYNSKEDTKNLVQNINKILDIPIVIVDNCSPSNDYEELKKLETKNVKVIKSNRNGGYAYGNNLGIEYAIREFNPKYIFIANPDIIINKSVVDEMLKVIQQDEKIGIVAPKMKTNNPKSLSAWKMPSLKDDIVLSISLLNRIFGNPLKYKSEICLKNAPVEVDVVQGAFFLVNVNALKKVGFFDEKTFLYGEERILAYKMKQKDYKVIFLPYVYFEHNVSNSVKKSFTNLNVYKFLLNSRIIYHKYYLKQSTLKINLLKISFIIGKIEKYIIYAFYNFFKGNR